MSCELPELSFSHEIDICLGCSWQCVAEHARHIKLHAVACVTWCLPNLLNAVCYLLARASSLTLEFGCSPCAVQLALHQEQGGQLQHQ